jgi:hypothetical protein
VHILLSVDQKEPSTQKIALMKNFIKQSSTVALRQYCALFIIFFFTIDSTFAEIKNGYENDISGMRESLKNLNAILAENMNLSGPSKRKIEFKIELLISNISYYELTENLLNQFKNIAPEIYNEIDTIKDCKGRAVNVFVKFIPTDGSAVKAWGTTYMRHVENDRDAYLSEYGSLSVSVKIWIVHNALLVLSHEFGHVKYQVQHLASYFEYYKQNYFGIMNDSNDLGHNPNDPSGDSANHYEKLFRRDYAYFLNANEKIENPVVLVQKLKRNLSRDKAIL